MYTCEDSELGGVQTYGVTDAKAMIAAQAARQADQKGNPKGKPKTSAEKMTATGSGTPLGRAFRKFTK